MVGFVCQVVSRCQIHHSSPIQLADFQSYVMLRRVVKPAGGGSEQAEVLCGVGG